MAAMEENSGDDGWQALMVTLQQMSTSLETVKDFQRNAAAQLRAQEQQFMDVKEFMKEVRGVPLPTAPPAPTVASPPVVMVASPPQVMQEQPFVPHKGPKMNEPTPFTGRSKAALRDFLTQVRLVVYTQPLKFPNDHVKCLYAASYLRETAWKWACPYIERDPPHEILLDFNRFCAELKRVFGDPDEEATAEKQILQLRQTGSAAQYASEFMRLATAVDWPDKPLCVHFYHGLKDVIKDEFWKIERPKVLSELMDLAIRLDERHHERKMERQGVPLPSRSSTNVNPLRPPPSRNTSAVSTKFSPPDVPNSSYPQPMDVDGARRFHPLTPEERQQRRERGECYYCGKPGHIAGRCPNKRRTTPSYNASASALTIAMDSDSDVLQEKLDQDKEPGNGDAQE
jgi:hypothetical protein